MEVQCSGNPCRPWTATSRALVDSGHNLQMSTEEQDGGAEVRCSRNRRRVL
jgi:hypothetical protein